MGHCHLLLHTVLHGCVDHGRGWASDGDLRLHDRVSSREGERRRELGRVRVRVGGGEGWRVGGVTGVSWSGCSCMGGKRVVTCARREGGRERGREGEEEGRREGEREGWREGGGRRREGGREGRREGGGREGGKKGGREG